MLCPICGKELPDKARKCDKCGCRPEYLYGRPKRPKWVIPTALALAVAILAGCLIFLSPPKETEEFYEISLLRSCTGLARNTQFFYDDRGNLKEMTYGGSMLSSSSSTLLVPNIQVRFYYDENGVFTKAEMLTGELHYLGAVEYDEEARTVAVRFRAEETLGTLQYLFQYGQDGRLEEYTYGTKDQVKTDLKYDEAGTLLSYTILQRFAGANWVRYRVDTLKHDAEGKVTSLVRQFLSNGYEFTYFCHSDQWGNVLKWEEIATYQYTDRQIVTGQTARQYELQLHLLNAMGIPMDPVIFPIMKTPSEKGDSQ